ncbi:MAG: voltage-gated chloride channel family protein [Bdellovibrionota bacterium]
MTSRAILSLCRHYSRWALISTIIGIGCGVASAIFLLALDVVTEFREQHHWLLYLLPIGGALVGFSYHYFGRSVEGGNNLIIDQFHDPQTVIPFRMAPLVLLGTLLTHLFGGSAGREGTAVQMGGSIADQLTHVFKVSRGDRRTLLMAGMAGGFGSVFGVPFAGTLFGLEVLAVGRLHLWAIVECAISAFVAHYVTLTLGVHHTSYVAPEIPELTFITGVSAIVAGIAFGGAARLFAFLSDAISSLSRKQIKLLPLRAAIGGGVLSLLYFVAPELTRYSGLGVSTILLSQKWPLPLYDWLGKLCMTALTLGVGFKGGEVTPLLFVGSTLGNALSQFLPISLPLLACVGFVAVFAGAANTPFACTVMAMELFGPNIFFFAALACFASYAVTGHHGIYHTQRIHVPRGQYVTRTIDFIKYLFHRPPL